MRILAQGLVLPEGRFMDGRSMSVKRFAIHPDEVISVNDGDRHYIGFRQLCDLYGVNPSECVDMSHPIQGFRTDNLLHLHVSYQGAAYWHISDLERNLYPIPDKHA